MGNLLKKQSPAEQYVSESIQKLNNNVKRFIRLSL